MRTIAVANQKGGCGKTTTAVNIASALAGMGSRVLLIDLDPQAHTTLCLGYDRDAAGPTMYDVMTNPHVTVAQAAVGTITEGLDLLPSNILLAGAELALSKTPGKELVLGDQLAGACGMYDLCVIDCPSSLGLLMINALVAGTDVLVPIQPHFLAMDGLKCLFEAIRMIRSRFFLCQIKPLGLLLTFVEDRTVLSNRVQSGMRSRFGNLVFDTVIHRTATLAEAPSRGQSIFTYAPDSRAAAEYRALAAEAMTRLYAQQTAGVGA